MDVAGLLADLFGPVDDEIDGAVDGLSADELATPPVTLGVRLVSIVDDEVQHAGQAAHARGILDRR